RTRTSSVLVSSSPLSLKPSLSSVSSSVSCCSSEGEDNGTGSSSRRNQGKWQERSGPDTAGIEAGSRSRSHGHQQACRGDQACRRSGSRETGNTSCKPGCLCSKSAGQARTAQYAEGPS